MNHLDKGQQEEQLDTLRKAIATEKSFVTEAIVTFFLYSVGWLPGFIANWLWLNEAKRVTRLAGRSPSGGGCLSTMFVLNIILIVFVIGGFLLWVAVLILFMLIGIFAATGR